MGNRTDFANYACKLLYDKYDGDFGAHDFYQQAVILRKHFEDNVRNIYELVDEIPLFLYVDYCTMYFEEGDIYNEKYEGWTKDNILKDIEKACYRQYAGRPTFTLKNENVGDAFTKTKVLTDGSQSMLLKSYQSYINNSEWAYTKLRIKIYDNNYISVPLDDLKNVFINDTFRFEPYDGDIENGQFDETTITIAEDYRTRHDLTFYHHEDKFGMHSVLVGFYLNRNIDNV